MTLRSVRQGVREDTGQIVVLAALLFTLILLVGGFAVDYGTVYLGAARFRNAVDAAALAGASERQLDPGGGTASATAVVMSYLALHGYAPDAATSISVSFPVGGQQQVVQIDATRTERTWFLRYAGISTVLFGQQTKAAIGGNRLDVVLAMDVTLSMTGQMPQLRQAAAAFIDQVGPSTSLPNGPRIGIVVFAGMASANGIEPPPASANRNAKVATYLTNDLDLLKKIADNSGPAACPSAWPSGQPAFTSNSFPHFFANTPPYVVCPLQAVGVNTYVGNGFDLALRPDFGSGWSMYDAAHGGRSDAKKILVLITDGTNNIPSQSQGNTMTRNSAALVKKGNDGVGGTADDVEIFTIGLFDPSQDPSSFATDPPLCPAAVVPASPGPSSNDRLLIDTSSSTAGSCDHYYPLSKDHVSELPNIFTSIAGRIARARLAQ